MFMKHISKILHAACIGAACATAAFAELAPVTNSNGTILGTIDSYDFDLPVFCFDIGGTLSVSSHDQTISNSTTTGGVEPALQLHALEQGISVTAFIGGARYKFLSTRHTVDTFPYTFESDVRARDIGEIAVEFVLDCPVS